MIDNVFESFKNTPYIKDGILYLPTEELLYKANKEYTAENGVFETKNRAKQTVSITADEERGGVAYTSIENIGAALGYTYTWDGIANIARIDTGESIINKLKLLNSTDSDRIAVYEVTASKSEGSSPYDTVDGNIGSYWAAQGDEEWIKYEFEEASEISHIDIKWHQSHLRSEKFEMYVSADGENWTEVFRGMSSGNTNTFERHNVNKTEKFKFVKIVGHGNTSNQWNSLGEIQFYNNYEVQK